MAKQTYIDRMKKLDAEYAEKMSKLREEMGGDFAKEIGPLIPEGWTLTWEQSDSQYDDQDYHFGLESFAIKKDPKTIVFGRLGGDGPKDYLDDDNDPMEPVLTELFKALNSVKERTYRDTFGECARVAITSDGTCTIKAIPSSR